MNANLDAAKRTIMLVDALYEEKVEIFALADCSIEDLFGNFEHVDGEKIAWKRCVSRLQEMVSSGWTLNYLLK